MSPQDKPWSERRSQARTMIKELLQSRQRVWSLYCTIGGLNNFSTNQPVESLIPEFCQALVDYISLGHFGIYQRITDGRERRTNIIKKAEEIYPGISDSTDAAIEFNDKYRAVSGVTLGSLASDLSRLGEELATRIDLEDQLIETIGG